MNEKSSIRLKFKDAPVDRGPAVQTASQPKPATHKPKPATHNPKPATHKPKPLPPTVGTEDIVVKCGHTIVFDLFAHDGYREQRRTKATLRDCPACRQARVQADMAAAKERRTKSERVGQSLKPRLPDGSRFNAIYDAVKVQWTGSLIINGVSFERSASSLHKLLHKLDDMYRAAAKPEPVVTQDPAVAAS